MVDSVRKLNGPKPGLGISETRATQEEKRRQPKPQPQPQEQNPENTDAFEVQEESLTSLSKGPRASSFVSPREVKTLVLRRAKARRDQAILELDVSLSDGTLIRGARMALNMQKVLSRLNRQLSQEYQPGDFLFEGTAQIFSGQFQGESFATAGNDEPTEWVVLPPKTPHSKLLWVMVALAILFVFLFVYIMFW